MDQEKSFVDVGPPLRDFYDETEKTEKTDKHFLPFRGVENDTPAYLPLNPKIKQIRYVAVDPGLGDEPISCFLGYVNLRRKRKFSRKLQYQAVSYSWGSIDDTVEITLRCAKRKSATVRSPQNAWRTQPYRVTRNLEALLRAFRLRNTHRILWIDAICINQADAAEKTHQVGDMSSIYSAASDVLVWLGEADLFSDIMTQAHKVWTESRSARVGKPAEDIYWYLLGGRKLGQLIVDGYPFSQRSFDHWTRRRRPHQGSKWLLGYSEVMKIITHSLDQCLSRPWFRRIWVLQEIVLAPITSDGKRLVTAYMGQSSIGWSDLVHFVQQFARKGSLHDHQRTAHNYKNIRFFNEVWSQLTSPYDDHSNTTFCIENYLSLTTAFTSSDPRDRLFAILQLARDTRDMFKTHDLLRPDYSKTLSQVLIDYRRWELGKFCDTVKHPPSREYLALQNIPGEHAYVPEDQGDSSRLYSQSDAKLVDRNPNDSTDARSGEEESRGHNSETSSDTDEEGSETDSNFDDLLSDDSDTDLDHIKAKELKSKELNSKELAAQLALDYLIGNSTPKAAALEPDMPSWVTNVLDGKSSKHLKKHFYTLYALYNACGNRPALQTSTASSLSISLLGQTIGKISEAVTPPLMKREQLDTLSSYLRTEWRHLWHTTDTHGAKAPGAVTPKGPVILDDLHRTIIEKFGVRQPRTNIGTARRTSSFGPRHGDVLERTPMGLIIRPRMPTKPSKFTKGIPAIDGTCVCLTERREFVLTSVSAMAGDIITIIYGGRAPLLLRPQAATNDQGRQTFKILGPCFFYRDKWMKGTEVAEGRLPETLDQFFELV